MPHLTLRNIPLERALEASSRLADRLADAIGCDRSWITVNVDGSRAVADGSPVPGVPYVTVEWFERPPEIARKVAKILSEELKGDAPYLTARFSVIPEGLYFEDGETV